MFFVNCYGGVALPGGFYLFEHFCACVVWWWWGWCGGCRCRVEIECGVVGVFVDLVVSEMSMTLEFVICPSISM